MLSTHDISLRMKYSNTFRELNALQAHLRTFLPENYVTQKENEMTSHFDNKKRAAKIYKAKFAT